MKYAAIHQYPEAYVIRRMYRVLGFSRSGYYDWVDRTKSARHQRHRLLMEKMQRFQQANRETYGSPRIHADLIASGETVGKNTVALLMYRAQIAPMTIRLFRVTTDSRKAVLTSNLLAQRFTADKLNERWVSDITITRTREG